MPVNPPNRLAILSAMRWLPVGLVVPVLVLLLGARGLPLDRVGQVLALYGVVTLLLELPTGGLADSWGRKPVIVASAMMHAIGLAMFALLGSLPAILAATAALGAARALSSGPVEAWFVDTMHAIDEPDVEPGLARGQIAESLALGVGSVVGGLLPALGRGLPRSGDGFLALSIPFAAASVMMLAYAVVAIVLITPERGRQAGSVGATVLAAGRQAVGEGSVRRVMIVALCLGVMLSGVELLAPNTFADLLGSATQASGLYGALAAAAFGVAAFGAAASTRLPGRRALVAAAAFVAGGIVVLLVAAPKVGVAALAFLALYFTIGVQGPVMAGLLHQRVGSDVRSTMMSVENLSLQAGGALASLVVGAAAAGLGTLAGCACVTAAALLATVTLLRDDRHGVHTGSHAV